MALTFVDPKTGARKVLGRPGTGPVIIDALDAPADQNTAGHYEEQWGPDIGFQDFARGNPAAMAFTPGKQLGWRAFFDTIRAAGAAGPTSVFDAGCGFGGVLDDLLAAPVPQHLVYVGADIHSSLGSIKRPTGAGAHQASFVRWDISEPAPFAEPFDFIVCRAVIHHTPEPRRTFGALVNRLGSGGEIAISAYARKARIREAVDDALRAEITAMSNAEAFRVANEFTALGQALRAVEGTVTIGRDLEWLGIKAGSYSVQGLIYDHMLKCFHNDAFGEKYSDVVNFDWYHPTHAFRYQLDELKDWFAAEGVEVTATASTAAQHFVRGRKS